MTDPGAQAGSRHAAEASRAVLGRGWIYTAGTASPILAQLVVTPAVTRLLGPDGGWGRVATGLVLVQVTMMLASLGFPSVITRQALLAGGGVAGARSLFLRGSLLTCAVSGVALVTRRWWGAGFGGLEADLALVAIGAGTLFVIVENGQALLRALDRPVAFVALSAVASLGGPLLGLALVLAGGEPGWLHYLLGLAGATRWAPRWRHTSACVGFAPTAAATSAPRSGWGSPSCRTSSRSTWPTERWSCSPAGSSATAMPGGSSSRSSSARRPGSSSVP
ncbi:MAG TPA: hypothetical protein VHM65_02860 [Candidatus Lustribacter sp.]|nr:hypothetical protein [Candidatus Lustribacter sp.]